VIVRQTLRHLAVLTWEADPAGVAARLPAALEPQLADGRALVSVVGLRSEQTRVGPVLLPPYAQVNVRTYVVPSGGGEPGIYLWFVRSGLVGSVGGWFGLPSRATLVRVRYGSVEARGAGVAFSYRALDRPPADVPALDPLLGVHDVAYFARFGNQKRLGRFVGLHAPIDWREAAVQGPLRLDPLLALGFGAGEPRWALYADRVAFGTQFPPRAWKP
jgi:hypothetical protein